MSGTIAHPPAIENDLYLQEAITPRIGAGGRTVSTAATPSPKQPAPRRLQAHRQHNNFVTAAKDPVSAMPAAPGRRPDGTIWAPATGEEYARRQNAGPFVTTSQRALSARRRPASDARSNTLSVRPGSAPGLPGKPASSARSMKNSPYLADSGWWLTPDESMVHTPNPASRAERRPAAEELQHELTMTATVLRTAQTRLAEEREQRLRARAAEELALVDVRRAKEEARASREEQRESDRHLTKALMAQRKELEIQLKHQEDEQQLKLAAIAADHEKLESEIREEHEDHARELEEQLRAALAERDKLIFEHETQHKREAERLAKAAAEHAELLEQKYGRKMEEAQESKVAHLAQIGIKRLMQQGLARGWTTWHDIHVDRTRRRRLLQVTLAAWVGGDIEGAWG